MVDQEYFEDIDCYYDLYEFCEENDIPADVHGLFDDEMRDNYYNDKLEDQASFNNWYDVKDWINDIPDSPTDWYEYNDNTDYLDGIDEDCDFERIKGYVRDYCFENGIFNDDEETNEYENTVETVVDQPQPEEVVEPYKIRDLFDMCANALKQIESA